MVSQIPTAHLLEYEGGHAAVLSNKRLWNDVTAFLETLDPRSRSEP